MKIREEEKTDFAGNLIIQWFNIAGTSLTKKEVLEFLRKCIQYCIWCCFNKPIWLKDTNDNSENFANYYVIKKKTYQLEDTKKQLMDEEYNYWKYLIEFQRENITQHIIQT